MKINQLPLHINSQSQVRTDRSFWVRGNFANRCTACRCQLILCLIRSNSHSLQKSRTWVIWANLSIYMLNQPEDVVSWGRMPIQKLTHSKSSRHVATWAHHSECKIILNHLFVSNGPRFVRSYVSLHNASWLLLCRWIALDSLLIEISACWESFNNICPVWHQLNG